MTISVCVLVTGGLVLAVDRRQVGMSFAGYPRVDSDHAEKLFPLGTHMAAVVCGQGNFYLAPDASPETIGSVIRSVAKEIPPNCEPRTAASLIHSGISRALDEHKRVASVQSASVALHVAGYGSDRLSAELYRCEVPGDVVLERDSTDAGAVWSGQRRIIDRLILGYDPQLLHILGSQSRGQELCEALLDQRPKLQMCINFQTMTMGDAVRLAASLIGITIDLLQLSDGIVGAPGEFPCCGGEIDIAAITPDEGFMWLSDRHKRFPVGPAGQVP